MKESGIVRKLDNLGRLVIPKEIRRVLRIKEGSPIEFGLLPSGEIVLTKYSLVGQISDYADDFCRIMGELFDCIAMVGDRDSIIVSYGISKKLTINAKLSGEVLDILDSRSSFQSCKGENTTIIPIFDGDEGTYYSQMIFPILIQGESEGVLILLDKKEDRCFGIEHITGLRIVAEFISKQME